MNFIAQLLLGQRSVSETFFVGWIGFNIFSKVFWFGFNVLTFKLIVTYDENLVVLLIVFITFLFLIYYCLLTRAMWRAKHNNRSPSAWSWIGITLIFCGGVLFNAYQIAIQFMPSVPVSKVTISAELKAINASVPQVIDEVTTLQGLTFRNGIYKYSYSVSSADYIHEGVHNWINEEDGQGICKQMEGYFKGPVERLEFSYEFEGAYSVLFIDSNDCFEFLGTQ